MVRWLVRQCTSWSVLPSSGCKPSLRHRPSVWLKYWHKELNTQTDTWTGPLLTMDEVRLTKRGLPVPSQLSRKNIYHFKADKIRQRAYEKRKVTHSGDRKTDSTVDLDGSDRLRAHSLTREFWDALNPGTAAVTSILTWPSPKVVTSWCAYYSERKSSIQMYNLYKREGNPG